MEGVYQECLERELILRGIPFRSQPELVLNYKGETLRQKYQADLICHEIIILELKAIKEISGAHQSQIINYLKTTGLRVGLLINFGAHPKATIDRFVV